MGEARVRPAGAAIVGDVDAVLGRGRANPNACWCQRFRRREADSNEVALHTELNVSVEPIGLLAYVDQVPAGWSRVMPRADLPGILGNRALTRILDEPEDAWWITCFTILPDFRGQGVGRALLAAAVERAKNEGGRVLDGHPVDVERMAARPSASALFTGTLSTFRALGFEEIGRTYPTRPVMRRVLR